MDKPFVGGSRPEYLTVAQVAEMLQVSEKSVYRWTLADASMPVLRIGGTTRFHRERLLAWLARREPRASSRTTSRKEDD